MIQTIQRIVDVCKGKLPLNMKRSNEWSAVRDDYLKKHPVCIVCGGTTKLQVHHIEPFHIHPEKELDPDNFATVCEKGGAFNCHLLFGHLGNFQSYNVNLLIDAAIWFKKIHERPMGDV